MVEKGTKPEEIFVDPSYVDRNPGTMGAGMGMQKNADAPAVDIGQRPFLTIVMVFCPSANRHFKRVLHAPRTRLHQIQ